MSAFDIQRVSLTIAVLRSISPIVPSSKVTVINLTGAALRVYTTAGDDTTYLDIADGNYWLFEYASHRVRPTETAFSLLPGVSGTAVLIWQ
jgi:hypothetical protein